MRTKLRSRLSLLFLSFALVLALPAMALADTVLNDVVIASGNNTITTSSSTTINYQIKNNSSGGNDYKLCDATAGSPVTVTINKPAEVTATPGSLSFNSCDSPKPVQFSSTTPGNYNITVTTSDSFGKYSVDEAAFTLHVTAPPPPSNTAPKLTLPANQTVEATGSDGAKVSFNATATDVEDGTLTPSCSPVSGSTFALGSTQVNCSVQDSGGLSASGFFAVTVQDTLAPTNIQFVGGPTAGSESAFGSVPAAPTCTADDSGSGLNSAGCVVTGYSNAVGSHTMTATATDNAGNQNTATRSYTVTRANQEITGFDAIPDKTFGDANFNVSATGGASGNPVTFAALGDCSFSGNTVQIIGAGSCTVTASQLGNGNYNDATSVERTFAIDKAATRTTVNCGTGPFTYNGSAQEPCSASVTGAGGLDASLAVGYLNNVNAGQARASASYAGSANYEPSSGSVNFTIAQATPSVNINWTDSTYNGNANAASASVSGVGNPPANLGAATLTYYAGSDTTGTALSGAPTNAGTYTVKASFAGSANYKAAEATKTITIAKADQTITFGLISSKIIGANFNVSPTATSGLSVSLTASGSCTVSGTNVSVTGVGPCTITASQAGNSNYNAASNVQQIFSATYNFTGFASPVDNNNVLNTAKAGQAIPLKWRLTDASGNPITNLASVKVTATSLNCALSTTTDLLEEYAAGSSGLQNLGDGYYQFNWKSPTTYANSCKTLNVDMGEGAAVTHTALFKFTK